jgi:hypothetical protein
VIGDRFGERLGVPRKRRRKFIRHQRIQGHHDDDDGHHGPADPPQPFYDEKAGDRRRDDALRRRAVFPALFENSLRLPGEPSEHRGAREREHPVIPRHAAGAPFRVSGIRKKYERQQQSRQQEEVPVFDEDDAGEELQVEKLIERDRDRERGADAKDDEGRPGQRSRRQFLDHALGGFVDNRRRCAGFCEITHAFLPATFGRSRAGLAGHSNSA